MKKLFIVMTFLFTLFLITGCKIVKFDESKGTLVVGLECNYTPFNWTETTKTTTNWPIDRTSANTEYIFNLIEKFKWVICFTV